MINFVVKHNTVACSCFQLQELFLLNYAGWRKKEIKTSLELDKWIHSYNRKP